MRHSPYVNDNEQVFRKDVGRYIIYVNTHILVTYLLQNVGRYLKCVHIEPHDGCYKCQMTIRYCDTIADQRLLELTLSPAICI
jgi:hypothetical protein